jgi:GNAT superfamily N-acetyltransferase
MTASLTAPQIRPARAEDAAVIAEFQLAMAWETEATRLDADTCRSGVRKVFTDPARGRYFVGELDGMLVGCLLTTYEWSDWRDGWVWWIHSVYVAPAARKLGVFRALYAQVREQALADPSVRGLRLYMEKNNERARGIYLALGMRDDHYDLFEWLKS